MVRRAKKSSGMAAEQRQEARETAANVVEISAETNAAKIELRRKLALRSAEDIESLISERKAINERVKACLDEVEVQGINRQAFNDWLRLRAMEAAKLRKYQFSRAELARASGWGDGAQVEMFQTPPVHGAIPGMDRPFLGADEEPGVGHAVAAAIEQSWLTEEELASNREIEEGEQPEAAGEELAPDELEDEMTFDDPDDIPPPDDLGTEESAFGPVTDQDIRRRIAAKARGEHVL